MPSVYLHKKNAHIYMVLQVQAVRKFKMIPTQILNPI